MTGNEVVIEIIYPAVLAIGVLLVVYGNNRLNAYSRRKRREIKAEMDKPEHCEKQQWKVFIQIGMAVYFLGAYLALSLFPNVGISWARATFGAVVAVLGAMAGANAKTMNEYGIAKQKEEYAKLEEKERRKLE
ncbi:MAG: hypothetical protein M3Y72_15860 [Acidobacteriota bacterium]|nr:hypothetical protein [Acidobacteriota bacterium]